MPASSSPRLIGLPYDASSSYLRGPAGAPPLIRAALHSTHWNGWTERGQDLSAAGVLTDAGDLPLSPTVHAREEIETGIAEVLAGGEAGARPTVSGDVYLSIDLDGLDPAFAPGVSHREPGGLSVRDVLTVVQSCGGTLVGADIVEYNPREDLAGVTAVVAAKIVKEVAGRVLANATAD